MAIIVVGGSNRGVGKTKLVCGLIAALPEYRWTAIKITTHDHMLPVSGRPITGGDSMPNPQHPSRVASFRQVFDKQRAERDAGPKSAKGGSPIWEETTPGEETDTARYLAAGAARAMLVSASDSNLADPLNELWPRFGRGSNLIFESNSVVHHVRADACILIHAIAERALPLPERKPSFIAALCHADAMVSHAKADKLIPDGLCLAGAEPAWEQRPASKPIFHLRALERISPEMLGWLRQRLPAVRGS